MKTVTVIKTSHRINSNSSYMADKFIEGLKINNNKINIIDLKNIKLNFCKGCLACQTTKRCIQNDSMNSLLDEISNSDILVFSSPVYYYTVPGQLKTFLDRLNPLYGKDNKFREIYLLASAGDDNISAVNTLIEELKSFALCFDHLNFTKYIFAGGITEPNLIKNNPEILNDCFQFGKSIK